MMRKFDVYLVVHPSTIREYLSEGLDDNCQKSIMVINKIERLSAMKYSNGFRCREGNENLQEFWLRIKRFCKWFAACPHTFMQKTVIERMA